VGYVLNFLFDDVIVETDGLFTAQIVQTRFQHVGTFSVDIIHGRAVRSVVQRCRFIRVAALGQRSFFQNPALLGKRKNVLVENRKLGGYVCVVRATAYDCRPRVVELDRQRTRHEIAFLSGPR